VSITAAFRAAGVPAAIAAREAPRATAAILEHGITTRRRAAYFLAQVLHESGRLRWFEELASGAAYEGRRDLGNTRPGDGRRYKGRGPIQLTGRANYRIAGQALQLPLEDRPTLASQHAVGWRIATWYMSTRELNELADRRDFVGVTRRINGGTNGLADRFACVRAVASHDCRPRRRPYEGLTHAERRWCREYDQLVKAKRGIPRRRELRRVMTRRRKTIWAAAQRDGWERSRRRHRYQALLRRTR
jgi:predicted chitinase